MNETNTIVIMAFPLFGVSLLFLWYVRREYRFLGKLSLRGTIIHILVFAPHGYLSGIIMEGPSTLPSLGYRVAVGIIFIVVGLVILIMGMTTFQSSSRILGHDASELKTHGIYRMSRNPQYIGYGIFFAGLYLLWWTPLTILGLVFYSCLVYFVVRGEEEHLARVYGRSYVEYCTRVPRFIGFRQSRAT